MGLCADGPRRPDYTRGERVIVDHQCKKTKWGVGVDVGAGGWECVGGGVGVVVGMRVGQGGQIAPGTTPSGYWKSGRCPDAGEHVVPKRHMEYTQLTPISQ